MRKMYIKGVAYTCKPLSFLNPTGTVGSELIVAWPDHDPEARPLFLIDNNGTNPFEEFSYASWVPAPGVQFKDK